VYYIGSLFFLKQVFPSGQENGFTFDRRGNNVIPKDSKVLKDKIQEAEVSIKNKAPQRGQSENK